MNEIIEKIQEYFYYVCMKYDEFKRSYIAKKIKRYFRYICIKCLKFERSCIKNRNDNTNYKFLLRGIVIFLIPVIGVMLFSSVEFMFIRLTGANSKLELLKFMGWGMSGLIAIFGVIGLLQRAAALDAQNKISEKRHIHECFKAAIEHLDSNRISVRISAFYEFYRLAEIELDLRKTIFDILCAHLRKTTKHKDYKNILEESEEIKPTEEMQSLLSILFEPLGNNLIFGNMNANLEGVHLQGADMQNRNLRGANLQNANLQKAQISDADLQRANLNRAYLVEVNLFQAKLQEARLIKANLQGARMLLARLQEANLQNANLQNANFCMAHMQNANLHETNLQEARLVEANLQGARLVKANLQGADMLRAKITERTTMPHGWKDMVKKYKDSKTGALLTGVLLVDAGGNVIKHL